MYENALAAGITSSGADAYLLHVTTTPCVSFITRTENFDCGVMISASHNPFSDNGIKLMNGIGEKMDDELQDELERYIDGEPAELPFAEGASIGRTVDFYSGRNRYIGYLTSLATKSFEKHTVALGLRQRQLLDDRARRVRRPWRQDPGHQQRARRREHQ
jgi:phosphoglucosamine mutase